MQLILVDDHESASNLNQAFDENDIVESIRIYLTNIRTISAIMTNVLYNELLLLVRERIVYDKELFNFEEYHT